MRRSKLGEEQIIGALEQAESGRATPELIRELGITETTFYRWRRKYGGLDARGERHPKHDGGSRMPAPSGPASI
jgi:putative transposase